MKVHGGQGFQTDDLLVTLCEVQSGNRELNTVTVSTDASVLGTAAIEPVAQHVPLVFSLGLLEDEDLKSLLSWRIAPEGLHSGPLQCEDQWMGMRSHMS